MAEGPWVKMTVLDGQPAHLRLERHLCSTQGPISIGRATSSPVAGSVAPAKNNAFFLNKIMSKSHAQLEWTNGVPMIRDLESSHGTFIVSSSKDHADGFGKVEKRRKLELGRSYPICDGDCIIFGKVIEHDIENATDDMSQIYYPIRVRCNVIGSKEADPLPAPAATLRRDSISYGLSEQDLYGSNPASVVGDLRYGDGDEDAVEASQSPIPENVVALPDSSASEGEGDEEEELDYAGPRLGSRAEIDLRMAYLTHGHGHGHGHEYSDEDEDQLSHHSVDEDAGPIMPGGMHSPGLRLLDDDDDNDRIMMTYGMGPLYDDGLHDHTLAAPFPPFVPDFFGEPTPDNIAAAGPSLDTDPNNQHYHEGPVLLRAVTASFYHGNEGTSSSSHYPSIGQASRGSSPVEPGAHAQSPPPLVIEVGDDDSEGAGDSSGAEEGVTEEEEDEVVLMGSSFGPAGFAPEEEADEEEAVDDEPKRPLPTRRSPSPGPNVILVAQEESIRSERNASRCVSPGARDGGEPNVWAGLEELHTNAAPLVDSLEDELQQDDDEDSAAAAVSDVPTPANVWTSASPDGEKVEDEEVVDATPYLQSPMAAPIPWPASNGIPSTPPMHALSTASSASASRKRSRSVSDPDGDDEVVMISAPSPPSSHGLLHVGTQTRDAQAVALVVEAARPVVKKRRISDIAASVAKKTAIGVGAYCAFLATFSVIADHMD